MTMRVLTTALQIALALVFVLTTALQAAPAKKAVRKAPVHHVAKAPAAPTCIDWLKLFPPGCTVPVAGKSAATVSLWQRIANAAQPDLQYALAMTKAANTPAANVRGQCLQAIIDLNQAISGSGLKDATGKPLAEPDPHLFTSAEAFAEMTDALQPSGPLFVNCSGAAQLAATKTLTFVNALVTGVAGIAKLGLPIP
jgi:hypothetical protein